MDGAAVDAADLCQAMSANCTCQSYHSQEALKRQVDNLEKLLREMSEEHKKKNTARELLEKSKNEIIAALHRDLEDILDSIGDILRPLLRPATYTLFIVLLERFGGDLLLNRFLILTLGCWFWQLLTDMLNGFLNKKDEGSNNTRWPYKYN